MEEMIIPIRGPMWSQTIEVIKQNGGSVHLMEAVLRNIQEIQEVKPYSNTDIKVSKVIFKSGEYIYYDKEGIWSDLHFPSSQNF